ncbi:hypothetical protein V2G26_020459 [Clonostachys chloroleuca]
MQSRAAQSQARIAQVQPPRRRPPTPSLTVGPCDVPEGRPMGGAGGRAVERVSAQIPASVCILGGESGWTRELSPIGIARRVADAGSIVQPDARGIPAALLRGNWGLDWRPSITVRHQHAFRHQDGTRDGPSSRQPTLQSPYDNLSIRPDQTDRATNLDIRAFRFSALLSGVTSSIIRVIPGKASAGLLLHVAAKEDTMSECSAQQTLLSLVSLDTWFKKHLQ